LIAPDGQTLNQIDHVIVNKNKSSMIQDIKTMHGLSCDSDHFVVKIIVKQKLITQQLNKIQQIKWNRINLQDINKLKQYRQHLHNKLEGKAESQNINNEWMNIKESVLDSANEVIQIQKYKVYNEWWDEECRVAIEKKNEARMKCMSRTRANLEDYIQKRKTANDICKRKKKAWLNNRNKEIEVASRRNDFQKFYKEIKSFSKAQPPLIPLCKGPNGDLISEKALVLQGWRQYFCELLNREDLIVR
jgi:hypothetical protein